MSAETNTESRPAVVSGLALDDRQQISLCEVLDRVLNKGVVVAGDVTISVADVDLIYLGLQLVLTSIETARRGFRRAPVELGAGLGIVKENVDGIA